MNELVLSFMLAIGIKTLSIVASFLWRDVNRYFILIQTAIVALVTSPLILAILGDL